jgi:FKBP-type peptidyl-prolyl cis-trans isomerase
MMTFGTGMALLVGCAAAQETATSNKSQEQAPAVSKPDNAPQQDPAFQNWKDKLSYAIGADLAKGLRLQRVDVNVNVLVEALSDTLAGNKLVMTQEEVTATLKRFENEKKQDYDHAKAMLSQKNKGAGDAFFAENVKKEGVVTLPSGLQYKVLKQGNGKKPTLEDTVVCNYRGTLLDGTEFDSSYKRNQAATLPVKGLLKGWSEALQLMPVGSKWQLFIPPALGYGERVVGGIAPNATLIFEVELISAKPTSGSGVSVRAERPKASRAASSATSSKRAAPSAPASP